MSRTPVPATPEERAAPPERAEYLHRRLAERIGMDLDAAMKERGLTIRDVADEAKLTRECVAQIIDGAAKDVDLSTLVDVFHACGFRIRFDMVQVLDRGAGGGGVAQLTASGSDEARSVRLVWRKDQQSNVEVPPVLLGVFADSKAAQAFVKNEMDNGPNRYWYTTEAWPVRDGA